MITAEGKAGIGLTETERIFEEYKQKLVQSLALEKEKMSEMVLHSAREEANDIINEAKKEAQDITQEIKELRQNTAAELADTQKKTADTIEQILANARKAATEKAENEAAEFTAEAKIKVRKEREILLAEALIEARTAAETETARILQKARQEAENISKAAKNKVRQQIEESVRLMLEIQQKMQEVIRVTGIEGETSSTQPTRELVNIRPTDSESSGEESQTYEGEWRIDIAPPVDSELLANLEQYLSHTDRLHVINRGQTEDGSAWTKINTEGPIHLLDILRKAPVVKDVVGCKSYVIVALKSKQTT